MAGGGALRATRGDDGPEPERRCEPVAVAVAVR